jgi:hypothetical protein
MKKLLLIGAMLVVGATSFSNNLLIKLNEDTGTSQQPVKYSGEGVMEIGSRGKIMSPAENDIVLIVRPAVSTGADHQALAFDFDLLGRKDTKIVQSEFIAEVAKADASGNLTLLPIVKDANGTSAISATVKNGQLQALYNMKNEKIGSIKYVLSDMSGLAPDKLSYVGRVKAEVATGRDETGAPITSSNGSTPLGKFSHSLATINVKVDQINVQ